MLRIDGRREFMLSALGLLVSGCASSRAGVPEPAAVAPLAERAESIEGIAEVERRIGGRLGVFALDTHTGHQIAHRADERFAMCSTFKWILAAQVLTSADQRQLALTDRISYGPADLIEHAPITRQHVSEGSMTIEALARAAVVVSDNTATNLLLSKVGGPSGFTDYVRSLGDDTTRLDRTELLLNTNEPGDARDTTSPRAMVQLMNRILCGGALSGPSRALLIDWMRSSRTGLARIRAGLPSEWAAGDKTGTGMRGACNDVAIAFPPQRSPVLIAAYASESTAELELLQAAHADAARFISARMAAP